MNLRDIVTFLHLLRVANTSISEDEDWVRGSCPLAPYKHFKGYDENPSFGVKVNPYGQSVYNCFTCGHGSLQDLIHKLNFTTGIPVTAQDFYSTHENFGRSQRSTTPDNIFFEDKYSTTIESVESASIPVPDIVLRHYPKIEVGRDRESDRARHWCLSRGISLDVAYKFGLRYDPEGMRIIFPIVDTDNQTYHLHSRSRTDKFFFYVRPDNSGYPEENWGRKNYWFGLQFYDSSKPVVLVESETDVLRLESLGVKNSLASCGPLNKFKLARVLSDLIYLGFDSDAQGAKYCMKAIKVLHSRAVLARLYWRDILLHPTTYYSTGRVRKKEKRAKDAGDILSLEQLETVFRGRKFIEIGGDGQLLLIDDKIDNSEGDISMIDKWAYSRSN